MNVHCAIAKPLQNLAASLLLFIRRKVLRVLATGGPASGKAVGEKGKPRYHAPKLYCITDKKRHCTGHCIY